MGTGNMRRFLDRRDAGKQLASKLLDHADRPSVAVLALPRGGVPVAYEVSLALHAPLDLMVVRKLGLPGVEELAMGAIASGGVRILNQDVIDSFSISADVINRVAERETLELKRREQQYRGEQPPLNVRNRIAILIDDGLATGASMLAAVQGLQLLNPAQIVVAVPVASQEAIFILKRKVDEFVCVMSPEPFEGVGRWYENFSQTTDQEVRSLMEDASKSSP